MNTERPTVKFYLMERDFLGPADEELNFLYVLAQAHDLFAKRLTTEQLTRASWWLHSKCVADHAALKAQEPAQ